MTERRFTDEEVAQIIDRATTPHSAALSQPSSPEGITLSQLQDIGREVGIPPEAIAHAARSLDFGDRQSVRRLLGLPIGVSYTAHLGRQLTDQEWQQLVVDLRETFDARGTVREEGAFRQWTNGNLQVMLEPTPQGNQIRLRTMKEDARAFIGIGLAFVGIGLAAFAAKVIGGADLAHTLQRVLPLGFIGGGLAMFGAIRVPSWARERRAQMASVVARLRRPPA